MTSELNNLSSIQWRYAVKRLRDLRLLAEKNVNCPDTLDCHPLIREHFGEKLQENNQDIWKEAHSRLYEYYKKLPEKHLPETFEEMKPLFVAVAHGCQAGRYKEVLNEVYKPRIMRHNKDFNVNTLRAVGTELSILASFFSKTWNQPIEVLDQKDQYNILRKAGLVLRGLSRLNEASESLEAAITGSIDIGDVKNAANAIRHLVQLYLIKGELKKASDRANDYVKLANQSKNRFYRMACRATRANVLYQQGFVEKAKHEFEEAERIHKEWKRDYPLLLWLHGYRYLELLLGIGEYEQVLNRIKRTLEWGILNNFKLADALYRITLTRVELLKRRKESKGDLNDIISYLNDAVADLQQTEQMDYLPLGYLARAAFYRIVGEFAKAWDDLEEAREIADRGEMGLYLADYHLEAGRLCVAEKKPEDAQQHLSTANTMIDEMGYHRRDKEVEELTATLKIERP